MSKAKSKMPTAPCWMPTSTPPRPAMAEPTAKMATRAPRTLMPMLSPSIGLPRTAAQRRPKRPWRAHVSTAATMANTTAPRRMALCVDRRPKILNSG